MCEAPSKKVQWVCGIIATTTPQGTYDAGPRSGMNESETYRERAPSGALRRGISSLRNSLRNLARDRQA